MLPVKLGRTHYNVVTRRHVKVSVPVIAAVTILRWTQRETYHSLIVVRPRHSGVSAFALACLKATFVIYRALGRDAKSPVDLERRGRVTRKEEKKERKGGRLDFQFFFEMLFQTHRLSRSPNRSTSRTCRMRITCRHYIVR